MQIICKLFSSDVLPDWQTSAVDRVKPPCKQAHFLGMQMGIVYGVQEQGCLDLAYIDLPGSGSVGFFLLAALW